MLEIVDMLSFIHLGMVIISFITFVLIYNVGSINIDKEKEEKNSIWSR